MRCILKNFAIYFIPLFKALKLFLITCRHQTKRMFTILFKLFNLCVHVLYISYLYVRFNMHIILSNTVSIVFKNNENLRR